MEAGWQAGGGLLNLLVGLDFFFGLGRGSGDFISRDVGFDRGGKGVNVMELSLMQVMVQTVGLRLVI